jgi:ADP-ribosylglycohydrolase
MTALSFSLYISSIPIRRNQDKPMPVSAPAASHFEEKIYAGWLGKAIGGTLGGPFEGRTAKLDLSYYDPVPDQALPNDDLDLQIVWLRHLLNEGVREVHPATLAEAWRRYVGFPWCEYGVGLRNMHYGLNGPELGAFDNWFADGMGAAIRTEIWAFLSAGNLLRAKQYAWADAIFDHAGDGVHAAVFFAVMESAAFGGDALDGLIQKGLAAIPMATRVSFAVRRTQYLWSEIGDWETVREVLITDLVQPHFTDVAINVAFTILGLLAGEGDFGKSICIANNCGWDTDCTAATVGALLGIMAPESIPDIWQAPLNGKVVLNQQIREIPPETTLSELTEQTLRLRRQLTGTVDLPMTDSFRLRARAGQSPIHIPYRFAESKEKSPGSPISSPASGNSFNAPGHWFRHPVSSSSARSLQFSFEAKIQDESPVRFMAYFQGRCRIFVDQVFYGEYCPAAWENGWHGPSFHLFHQHGPSTPALALTPGIHRFDVLLDHDRSDSVELVVGVADAETNQWHPFGLASKV